MSEQKSKIVRVVFDSKTGRLSDAPHVDPKIDLKARIYVSENCTFIPVGDEEAITVHARKLCRMGLPQEWAVRYLRRATEGLWSDSKSDQQKLLRGIARSYKLEQYLGVPASDLEIRPTPWQWIDPHIIPQRSWLYRPMYIRKFFTLTAATGGTGKTSLGLVENAAMVTGKPLLGITPGETDLRAWYWNGEDPADEMQRRWVAVVKHYGLTEAELDGRFFLDSGRDMPIKIATLQDGKSSVSEPTVSEVIYAIKHSRIDVLNIDPFVSSHSVTENDTAAIQMVAEQWAHIANETECAVSLWHHTRKTRGEDAAIEDARGASALISAARGRRVLNKMTGKEAADARLSGQDRGFYFWSDTALSSMAAPTESREWYKLESVNLGNGPLKDGDDVGVAVAWQHPAASALVVDDEKETGIENAIRNGGPWRASPKAKDWIGHAFAKALGLNLESKVYDKQVKALVAEWSTAGRLETYTDKDYARIDREYIRLAETSE